MKKIKIIFIAVSIILCLICVYFLIFKNIKSIKKSNKELEQTTSELEKQSNVLDVKFDIVNTWDENKSSMTQYNLVVSNISNCEINDWKIEVKIPKDMKIFQIWNGSQSIENDVLTIKSNEYNPKIKIGDKADIGFIARSSQSIDVKNIRIFGNGKILQDYKITGENEKSSLNVEDSIENVKTNNIVNNEVSLNSQSNNIEFNKTSDNINENILKRLIEEGLMNMRLNKTPVEKYGKLSVNDNNMVDNKGNIVQLKGVSTHSIAIYSQYINKETFKEMRDKWGISVIRIAMYSNPKDGYSNELHEKVKQAVNYASDLGIYVIIDWHILQDNNPNIYKTEAIEFFKEMATDFKDNKNVLYEICNEPNGNVKWENDIKPYAENVISEIRKIDNDSIVIVGTPNWSQDVDIVADNPISDYKNIMYTLHFYSGTHKLQLRNKLQKAIEKKLPIFVTEFGISDASGNGSINAEEGDLWIDMLNKYSISWVCWNLSNKNESSAILKSNCDKINNFVENDFSEEGIWLLNKLKAK